MDSRQMEVFMQVVESRSLSDAAKKLSLSQPAVTSIVKRLEEEYDTELFARVGKSLLPNTQARLLYSMAREAEFARDMAHIGIRTSGRTSQNVIIAVDAYSDHFFELAGKFSKAFPDYCLIIKSSAFFAQARYHSAADFYLTYRYMASQDEKLSIDIKDRIYVVLPREHHLADRSKIDLHTLRDEYFVCLKDPLNKDTGYGATYSECLHAGFIPKVSVAVDNPAGKYSAIAAGCGIGLVYNTELRLAGATRNCVLADCGEAREKQAIALAWRQDRLSEPAKVFLNWIKAYRNGASYELLEEMP